MSKDRIDGIGKEIKGSLKEAAGKVTGNPRAQAEGAAEKTVGKIQHEVGKAEDQVKHELHKH